LDDIDIRAYEDAGYWIFFILVMHIIIGYLEMFSGIYAFNRDQTSIDI